ncbi:MAG: hypothetical protein ACYDCL_01020 [Myxococcales bacterium]
MAKARGVTTVRRSVALPRKLARGNGRTFEEAVARMAADPQIRAESLVISREFEVADRDGLE